MSTNEKHQRRYAGRSTLLALPALLLVSTACSPVGFTPVHRTVQVTGPGTYTIAPKVDFLVAVDDTGGMSEAYQQIRSQIPHFLNQLESSSWDYHLATTPLTTERPMRQVVASRHDINWGSHWIAPFPGANPLDYVSSAVALGTFRAISNYSDYVVTPRATGAREAAFETILKTLDTHQVGTRFLRDDALTVVFTIGTGDDTSRRTECQDQFGRWMACDLVNPRVPECGYLPQPEGGDANCSSHTRSMNHYAQAFRSLKSDPATIRFFAAINNVSGSNRPCSLAGNAWAHYGKRYVEMASRLNGKTYDICTQTISSILTSLKSELQTERREFVLKYLFIDQEPELDTVQVTVYRASNPSVAEIIPQDPDNGWTYVGLIPEESPVYAIESPVPMNLMHGHALELNGAGKIRGDDRVEVTFMPAGLRPSEKN